MKTPSTPPDKYQQLKHDLSYVENQIKNILEILKRSVIRPAQE